MVDKGKTLAYYRIMEEDDMILSYKGMFTPRILSSLLEILEIKIKFLNVGIDRERRTLRVMVECFQNLYHHLNVAGQIEEIEIKEAMIVVKRHKSGFAVKTGNLIHKDEVKSLTEKLNLINDKSQDELRELYRFQLKNNQLTEKGTAGLGFIDIARKAKSKLNYVFEEIDDEHSFFCLKVIID